MQPRPENITKTETAGRPPKPGARIYLAGPMRGLFMFNFSEFDKAEEALRTDGWEVISPANLDRQAGFDPKDLPLADYDWEDLDGIGFDLPAAMHRCAKAIISDAEAIALLPGWEKSRGAQAELALAQWKGLPVYLLPSMARMDQESVLEEALRITGGSRHESYGDPAADFKRTAALWSALKGVRFEAKEVAMFMICVKLSREVHKPKRDNWTDAAGYAHCGSLCPPY